MSDSNKDVIFSLKVVMNKQKRKVLFAEVDSSFADVLLSFLTLPLGRIVRILKNHYGDEAPAFGSFTTLYDGLANLDSVHFWTQGAKSILLHPRSSSDLLCHTLKLDISDSPPLEYFVCERPCREENAFLSLSVYYDNVTACRYSTSHSMRRKVAKKDSHPTPCDDGVFTTIAASFVITGDLRIVSNTTGLVQILSFLDIADMDKAEEVNTAFGFSEVMDLLKASLISSTPLSDVIFNKTGQMNSATMKLQHNRTLSHQIEYNASTSNSKKMTLRVIVQNSTSKVVYAQAEEDFVELLFSFLVIPLGRVENLLVSNSSNKCMDLLHMSVTHHLGNKHFKHPDIKKWLIKPKIPHGYISENHLLAIIEEGLPDAYSKTSMFASVKFPKGRGKYLKAPRTFMVTDDLTVMPLCIASALSLLKRMEIPVSDVKEVEMKIGLVDALGILKASLTSTSALSNGLNLNNHTSNKRSKKDC